MINNIKQICSTENIDEANELLSTGDWVLIETLVNHEKISFILGERRIKLTANDE